MDAGNRGSFRPILEPRLRPVGPAYYETTLELGRGHHRLLVVGPDGLGAAVEVQIQ